MAEIPKIPTIIITGFLGSGKTTLLNRLLADGVKTAVIINEFGATPIDQDLLHEQNIPLTVLAGGCLCCQIKGALAPTLKNLRMVWENTSPKPFERVIIETSGVASPEPIIDTLLREAWIAKRYFLKQIVTTLAIPSAVELLARHAEARSQVVWADILLLTHADLADAKEVSQLSEYLLGLAPATPTLTISLNRFDTSHVWKSTAPIFRRLPPANVSPEHHFQSLSLYLDPTPAWIELQAILQKLVIEHSAELLRIKGIVYPTGHAEPLIVQAKANHLYPPKPLIAENSGDKRSRLVFIAASGIDFLAKDLIDAFGSSISPNSIKLH